MNHLFRFAGPLLALLLALPTHAQSLPHPGIGDAPITVSGISSGAFMADQFHVAHAALVDGVGLVAGGLYGCAVSARRGDGVLATASRALNQCMRKTNFLEKPQRFIEILEESAERGMIDSPSHLRGDRVILFSGAEDTVVGTRTVETAAAVLAAFGAEVTLNTDLPAGHAFLTEDRGNPCGVTAAPFVNDCDFDQAGAILGAVLGEPLAPPSPTPTGTLWAFSQAPFIPDGKAPVDISLWDQGFLYVPEACETVTAACQLHVAFHGCLQSVQVLDGENAFPRLAGYNAWADTNRLVILYPQARSIGVTDGFYPTEINPNGCWNWWGYANDAAYLYKSGDQISAVKAMVDALRGN